MLELGSWWMMQFWISVFGYTASMAAENPVRLSVQAMNMSSTPRFSGRLARSPRTLRSRFRRPTCPKRLSCRPDLRRWRYRRLFSRSVPRCEHGSEWHQETLPHRPPPAAAADIPWRWEKWIAFLLPLGHIIDKNRFLLHFSCFTGLTHYCQTFPEGTSNSARNANAARISDSGLPCFFF